MDNFERLVRANFESNVLPGRLITWYGSTKDPAKGVIDFVDNETVLISFIGNHTGVQSFDKEVSVNEMLTNNFRVEKKIPLYQGERSFKQMLTKDLNEDTLLYVEYDNDSEQESVVENGTNDSVSDF